MENQEELQAKYTKLVEDLDEAIMSLEEMTETEEFDASLQEKEVSEFTKKFDELVVKVTTLREEYETAVMADIITEDGTLIK